MAENTRFGREPIEVVEIGQDFCSRTYGELPCRATTLENLLRFTTDYANNYWRKFRVDAIEYLPEGNVVKTKITTLDEDCEIGSPIGSPNIGQIANGSTYGSTIEVDIDERYTEETASFLISATANYGQIGESVNSIKVTVLLKDGSLVSVDKINEGAEGDSGYQISAAGSKVIINTYATIFSDSGINYDENLIRVAFLYQKNTGTEDSVIFSRLRMYRGQQSVPYIETSDEIRVSTGSQPCFNTRSTCQDPANYDRQTLPLKFVDKRSPLPKDDYYIPSLTGVSVTPAKLNPGGANRNASALGERAAVSLTFQDHPHNDRLVDPYRKERDYDPSERGTFWSKWRARNPYYMQRPITLRSGYLKDGQIVDEITRAFVITGFSGPDSSGRVQIKGKDVLTLAEDSKAQAPNVSTGRLAADITTATTSITLSPAGVGNLEYPASGFVRIGKEVMAFTRSGDSMTITRGQFGTEADEHDADDTVQLCLRYVSQAPQDILYDLLRNYAGIPDIYLDKAGWDAEAADQLQQLYTAIITEPEGVSKLISEMCQQMYFTIWFDERESKVKLRAVRLAQNDEVFELDDNMHLLENSISWRDLSDELITQVWVFYGQNDPTEKLDQADNYASVSVTGDPLAEGPDKHNLRRIKKVYSRWISAFGGGAADNLGRRILNRYGNAPREVTFRVDAKDNHLWLGDYIRLTNRLRVDRFGLPSPVNLQIFQAQESALGSEFQFTAQEFIPALTDGDVIEDPSVRTIDIRSDALNVNLRLLHDEQWGTPTGNETITFIVRNGVTIGGDAAGGGVNVPVEQRVATNDFYDGGTSVGSGVAVGQVPILQRQDISAIREYSAGDQYLPVSDLTLDANVKEYPTAVSLDTGDWPSGVTLRLVVEAGAAVVGQGGNGAAIGYRFTPVFWGGDGGDAFRVRRAIEITNGGIIAGGGAGGSAYYEADVSSQIYTVTAGGAGAGLWLGTTKGNTLVDYAGAGNLQVLTNNTAGAGSRQAAGAGGLIKYRDNSGIGPGQFFSDRTNKAGNGGALAGLSGDLYTIRDPDNEPAVRNDITRANFQDTDGAFSRPGKAIRSGANLITWVNKGDVRGEEVN